MEIDDKTFKVVFNKARGALIAVNEVTKAHQAGKKSAVAVAVMAAFSSVAASGVPVIPDTPTIAVNVKNYYGSVSLEEGQTAVLYADPTQDGGGETSTLICAQNGANLESHGEIWVIGGGDYGRYGEGMGGGYIGGATSTTNTVTNYGKIYVKSYGYSTVKAMGSNPGTKVVNAGEIIVDGGFGMVVNSGADAARELINAEGAVITVLNGAGIYYEKNESSSRTEISNAGTINASGETSAGVYLGEAQGAVFKNSGAISGTDGANAVTIASGEFTMALQGAASDISGTVKFGENAAVAVTAEDVNDEFTLDASSVESLSLANSQLVLSGAQQGGTVVTSLIVDADSALEFVDGRSVTIDSLNNAGSVTADKITTTGVGFVNSGSLNARIIDLKVPQGLANGNGIEGTFNALEELIYRGTGENAYGMALNADISTPLLTIVSATETGLKITSQESIANIGAFNIVSNAKKNGLIFANSADNPITVEAPITLTGAAD